MYRKNQKVRYRDSGTSCTGLLCSDRSRLISLVYSLYYRHVCVQHSPIGMHRERNPLTKTKTHFALRLFFQNKNTKWIPFGCSPPRSINMSTLAQPGAGSWTDSCQLRKDTKCPQISIFSLPSDKQAEDTCRERKKIFGLWMWRWTKRDDVDRSGGNLYNRTCYRKLEALKRNAPFGKVDLFSRNVSAALRWRHLVNYDLHSNNLRHNIDPLDRTR